MQTIKIDWKKKTEVGKHKNLENHINENVRLHIIMYSTQTVKIIYTKLKTIKKVGNIKWLTTY